MSEYYYLFQDKQNKRAKSEVMDGNVAISPGKTFIIRDLGNIGDAPKYIAFNSYIEYEEAYAGKEQKRTHEVVLCNFPQRFRWDYDLKQNIDTETGQIIIEDFVKQFDKILSGIFGQEFNIIICSSWCDEKFGFHIIVPDLVLKDSKHQNQ